MKVNFNQQNTDCVRGKANAQICFVPQTEYGAEINCEVKTLYTLFDFPTNWKN